MSMNMDDIKESFKLATKYLEEHSSDIVIINGKYFSLKEVMKLSLDDLYKLLSVRPGMKLYKYCPLNKYTNKKCG